MNNLHTIAVGDIQVANNKPFVLFGGMNVLESRDMAMRIAEHYKEITTKPVSYTHLTLPTTPYV